MNPNIEYHDKLILGEDLLVIHPRIGRLVDLNNTGNVIEYAEMTPAQDHCYFIYNKAEKCLAPNSFIGYNNQDDFVMVSIPKAVLELKHAYSLRGNDEINAKSIQNQQGFQMLGLRYAERMLGITPQVKIGYSDYYFRLAEGTLGRSLAIPELYLQNLQKITTKDGTFYEGLYNFKSHELVERLPLSQNPYEDHYWMRIPEENILDPVGNAIKEGRPPYTYLNQHPLQSIAIPMYLDQDATVRIVDFFDYHPQQIIEAKQKFIDEMKAGQITNQPETLLTNSSPSWQPFEKEQGESRMLSGKIQTEDSPVSLTFGEYIERLKSEDQNITNEKEKIQSGSGMTLIPRDNQENKNRQQGNKGHKM